MAVTKYPGLDPYRAKRWTFEVRVSGPPRDHKEYNRALVTAVAFGLRRVSAMTGAAIADKFGPGNIRGEISGWSRQRLADELGVHSSTVSRHIRDLRRFGLLADHENATGRADGTWRARPATLRLEIPEYVWQRWADDKAETDKRKARRRDAKASTSSRVGGNQQVSGRRDVRNASAARPSPPKPELVEPEPPRRFDPALKARMAAERARRRDVGPLGPGADECGPAPP